MAKHYSRSLDIADMKAGYDSCFHKYFKTFDEFATDYLSKDEKLSYEKAYTLLSHIQKDLEKRRNRNCTDIAIGVIIKALDDGKIKLVRVKDGSYRNNRIFYHPNREYPLKNPKADPDNGPMNTIDFDVDQYSSNSSKNCINPITAAYRMIDKYNIIYIQVDYDSGERL